MTLGDYGIIMNKHNFMALFISRNKETFIRLSTKLQLLKNINNLLDTFWDTPKLPTNKLDNHPTTTQKLPKNYSKTTQGCTSNKYLKTTQKLPKNDWFFVIWVFFLLHRYTQGEFIYDYTFLGGFAWGHVEKVSKFIISLNEKNSLHRFFYILWFSLHI